MRIRKREAGTPAIRLYFRRYSDRVDRRIMINAPTVKEYPHLLSMTHCKAEYGYENLEIILTFKNENEENDPIPSEYNKFVRHSHQFYTYVNRDFIEAKPVPGRGFWYTIEPADHENVDEPRIFCADLIDWDYAVSQLKIKGRVRLHLQFERIVSEVARAEGIGPQEFINRAVDAYIAHNYPKHYGLLLDKIQQKAEEKTRREIEDHSGS